MIHYDRQLLSNNSVVALAGMSYRTKSCALSAGQDEARLDEVFEWPIGRPIDPHETLDIHLINKSKYNIAGVNR